MPWLTALGVRFSSCAASLKLPQRATIEKSRKPLSGGSFARRQTALTRANDQAIRRALEQAGVEFIDAEKGGPGVRLRAPLAES
jgi:hypothetical protein